MVLSVSFLHFGRQFTGGKHKGHSGSGQQGRTDIPGHIRAGGIVECCADLGADKGTDAVADEDQAIVAVVIFAAEHVFDDGRKHDQQPAEREADQADAGDEVGQRFGDRQHAHRKAVEDQYQNQRVPALELIIDKAKADAIAAAATDAQSKADKAKNDAVAQVSASVTDQVNTQVNNAVPGITTTVQNNLNAAMDSKIQTQVQAQLGLIVNNIT